MTKPGKKPAGEESKGPQQEGAEDLKKSTLTDYLPRFFGGGKKQAATDDNS